LHQGTSTSFKRLPEFLLVASLVLTAFVPLMNVSPLADLSRSYSDHLHHTFATYLFWLHGHRIYTEPTRNLWGGATFPFPSHAWGQMPLVYPPGMLVVFSPLVALAKLVPMSGHAFAVVSILWMLVLTHWALWAVFQALRDLSPGARGVVVATAWMFLVYLALEGFFDAVYIGCGAMLVRRIAQRDDSGALRWFAAAALLHFRAVVLAPLAGFALYRLWNQRPWSSQVWRTMGLVAVALTLCAGTFILMYPVTSAFRSESQPGLWGHPREIFIVVVLSGFAALSSAAFADPVVALTVALCAALGLTEVQNYWWHGAILLVPPLAVGCCRTPLRPGLARTLLVVWAYWMEFIVWRGRLTQLFPELWRNFRIH
jgi:hypothetical protein